MSQDLTSASPVSGWRRFTAALPMRGALIAVAVVWLLGCAWSFQEQSAFAHAKGFQFPHLLPLVIDGLAVAMAGVAWAASLDARPAIPARLATLVAVAGSAASNGVWAWQRSDHDLVSVVLAVSVPAAANLAFEVLLAELRRQVQRRRGMPAPVAIPYPRMIRVALSPWATLREWRALVLDLTRTSAAMHQTDAAAVDSLSSGHGAAARLEAPTAATLIEHAEPRRIPGPDSATDLAAAPAIPAGQVTAPAPTGAVTSDAVLGTSPAGEPANPGDDLDSTAVLPAVAAPGTSTAEEPGVAADAASEVGASSQVLTLPGPRDGHRVAYRPSEMRSLTSPGESPEDPGAAPQAQPPTQTTGADDGRDPRVQHLLTLLSQGRQMTGVGVAQELDCSDRTGRRLLRVAQQLHDQMAVPAR